MEKKMESEMETGGIYGFKELSLSFYIGESLLITIYIYIYVPLWQPYTLNPKP